jgi:Cu/Ag efflux pump CusA
MLCILAVFLPVFAMERAVRNIFVPLALAVGFPMIASYLLSSMFVPVISVWLIRWHGVATTEDAGPSAGIIRLLQLAYAHALQVVIHKRKTLVSGYLACSVPALLVLVSQVGREIFPSVDTRQFLLCLRAHRYADRTDGGDRPEGP